MKNKKPAFPQTVNNFLSLTFCPTETTIPLAKNLKGVKMPEPSWWDKIWWRALKWMADNAGYPRCPQMYFPNHVMPQEYREYKPYFPGNYRSYPIY